MYILFQSAQLHPETEVKGTSLRALARVYYNKVRNENILPDKEIIHLFLRNCDDTTYVDFCGKRIGEIAREGIKLWMDVDYGELVLEPQKIKIGKDKTEMTIEQYREWWWNKNQERLMWDKKSGKFSLVTK